ncbi:hypothetical protein [Sphingobacterium paludis]|uniref:Uncharacterized protein n=1 Tax=Sphingobacterium paludis TaxID=1476465 RepID=A0A4R7CSJ6_9SPHI|nr:hypothetical protein [Sphingobacterium paludis]TDS10971.1 hypothetical protein B0I21_10828 [Sphingobacterium paludis]
MFRPTKLSPLEILLLVFTSTIVVTGVVISRINVQWFEEVYAVEDGFVENWTLVPLLFATIYALYQVASHGRYKTWHFNVLMLLVALFSFFVAGEEISWGQRVFDVQSSEFFKQHNSQAETNLHNMVVGDKKINKIVFSQLLTGGIAFYLLVLPLLYSKKTGVKSFVDKVGLPIAQLYQIAACLLLFGSILFIPSGKNAEILEAGITTLFLLIFLFPQNAWVFEKEQHLIAAKQKAGAV